MLPTYPAIAGLPLSQYVPTDFVRSRPCTTNEIVRLFALFTLYTILAIASLPLTAHVSMPLGLIRGTVMSINLTGAVLPVIISLWIIAHHRRQFLIYLTGIALSSYINAVTTYVNSEGEWCSTLTVGTLIALGTVLCQLPASFAFVSGILGVLIGSDIVHNAEFLQFHFPYCIIGGFGALDAILVEGLFACFLVRGYRHINDTKRNYSRLISV